MLRPLTSQLVGSYTKPAWMARLDRMSTYDGSWWRVEPDFVPMAARDASLLAIYDQERAGLVMLTDGEAQRQAFDRHFFARMEGVDATHLAQREVTRNEMETVVPRQVDEAERNAIRGRVPRITGPIRWPGPLCLDEVRFLKRHTQHPVKVTVIGALTSLDRVVDEYYGDEVKAVMAMADALNQEIRALDEEGVDLIQIDEPVFHFRVSRAKRYGMEVLERMVAGVRTPIAVHVCYGYAAFTDSKGVNPAYKDCLEILAASPIHAISLEYEQPGHEPDILEHCGDKHVILGLLDLGTEEVETVAHVEGRIADALQVVPARRLHPSSDCGLWFLPREVAFGKIQALGMATERTRQRLGV